MKPIYELSMLTRAGLALRGAMGHRWSKFHFDPNFGFFGPSTTYCLVYDPNFDPQFFISGSLWGHP